jgi:hypothetical protein
MRQAKSNTNEASGTKPMRRRVKKGRSLARQRNTSSRAPVAYHEAAHAVLICMLRALTPERVTIIPSGGYDGRVIAPRPWSPRTRLDFDMSPTMRVRVESEILILLAGEIAQRRAYPLSVRAWHASSDHRKAADLADRMALSAADADAFLAWMTVRAADLVDLFWPTIRRVADALLANGTLDADAISAAVLDRDNKPRSASRPLLAATGTGSKRSSGGGGGGSRR